MYCRVCGKQVEYSTLDSAQRKGDSFCYCSSCCENEIEEEEQDLSETE